MEAATQALQPARIEKSEIICWLILAIGSADFPKSRDKNKSSGKLIDFRMSKAFYKLKNSDESVVPEWIKTILVTIPFDTFSTTLASPDVENVLGHLMLVMTNSFKFSVSNPGKIEIINSESLKTVFGSAMRNARQVYGLTAKQEQELLDTSQLLTKFLTAR